MRKRGSFRKITICIIVLCLLHYSYNAALGGRLDQPAPSGPNGGQSWLDLLPNILKGLDLIATDDGEDEQPSEMQIPDTIEVWNGEEALSMKLEEYIVHVVAAEMPASYAEEALKAQAVAARTYAVKHMLGEERCKSGYTICTDHTCCQAYLTTEELHSSWGTAFDRYFNKICSAVSDTKSEVIVCDGELITAVYHSSSGGRTENCEAVFAMALPYLVSVESAGEESSPEFSKETTYTASEFVSRVNEAFPLANMKTPVGSVDIWDRTESGRVKLVRLGDTVVTGQQMRNAFKLHSTNFSFEINRNEVKITCLGFGHGVGMSQCGANAMAKEGADYLEILTHYYTGVDITRINLASDESYFLGLWRV